jgi:hypothetical protein
MIELFASWFLPEQAPSANASNEQTRPIMEALLHAVGLTI